MENASSTGVNGVDTFSAKNHRTLAIPEAQDETGVRTAYRPFLLDRETTETDWVSQLGLDSVMDMVDRDLATTGKRLKVLVLYGSLRRRSVYKSRVLIMVCSF